MIGYSYRVLLLLTLSLCLSAHAQPQIMDCHNLFNPILSQEPLLQSELSDLEHMCMQDIESNNEKFWHCIDDRMKKGPINFERLILSSHVCSDVIE
ncbi:hypothetical protein ACU6U9_03280 [Pseudomonas sp. HK3]|jgi:hypothetical protein